MQIPTNNNVIYPTDINIFIENNSSTQFSPEYVKYMMVKAKVKLRKITISNHYTIHKNYSIRSILVILHHIKVNGTWTNILFTKHITLIITNKKTTSLPELQHSSLDMFLITKASTIHNG
jgi:hypothetical protein